MTEPITPELIRALRERLGLTQAAFAERIGCTQTAVSQWETGDRKPIGLYAKAIRALMNQPPQPSQPQ